jgi:hypothetical protein
MKKYFLVGASALVLVGLAYAQQLTFQTLSGNETLTASLGGPQGTSFFIPISQLRNANGIRTFSGSGAFTTQATTNDSTLFWIGAAPTTWTITTPVTPWDGQILTLATDTTLTTMVTLTAATGQTLQAAFSAQTLTAGTPLRWQFVAATLKWQRIQ